MPPRDTHWLCTLRPARADMPAAPTTREQLVVAEHFAYYQDLHDRGLLTLAGRTTEPPFVGLLIFRAASADQARAIVDADPAVAKGVMHADVQPFRVALAAAATTPDQDRTR